MGEAITRLHAPQPAALVGADVTGPGRYTERVHRRVLQRARRGLLRLPMSSGGQLERRERRRGKVRLRADWLRVRRVSAGRAGTQAAVAVRRRCGRAAEADRPGTVGLLADSCVDVLELRLVFIGNKRERVRGTDPTRASSSCELRGYVSEAELRQAYAESLGLFLLSDCEAFGIPILEALASGTPVFLSRLGEMVSLFGPFRGAHFCPADSVEGTVESSSPSWPGA